MACGVAWSTRAWRLAAGLDWDELGDRMELELEVRVWNWEIGKHWKADLLWMAEVVRACWR